MRPTTIAVATTITFLLQGAGLQAQMAAGTTTTQPELAYTAQPGAAIGSQADPAIVSNVRIVRLSLARGTVQMDRGTGRGFEPAIANMPVIKGAKLRTGEGVAEIEFEDNSSLRLTPHSQVNFDQLGRTASGATVSAVDVLNGTAYVSLAKTKDNIFKLIDGEAKIDVYPGTSLRLAAGSEASLAVFVGEAQVDRPGGSAALLKKQTLRFSPSDQTAPTFLTKTEEEPFDGWDKTQQNYHKNVSALAGAGGGAGLYGVSDLNYYGQFSSAGGCGNLWRPYFASAAWDPFANGAWALYPGAGYSWVSPYPWGWLPFHSGSWQQCGASGWGWSPGGQWYGVQNMAAVTRVTEKTMHPRVPLPPAQSRATLIPVNTRPLVVSGPSSEENFTFRRDSAGLGVPRETFGRLHSESVSAGRHGSSTATNYSAATSSFASPTSLATTTSVSASSRAGNSAVSPAHSSYSSAPAMSSAPSMSSAPAMSGASASGGGASHR